MVKSARGATTYNSRWSFSWLYCLGDPSKDAKHYRRCFLFGGGYSSFFRAAAEHFLELFVLRHLFIEQHWHAQHQRHSLSQEQRKALQPHTDLKLGSRSDHSFIPGSSRSRAGYKKPPKPHYLYITLNKKPHLLYLSKYLFYCHSAYHHLLLQVLDPCPKMPQKFSFFMKGN